MRTVLFIRHGATEGNTRKRYIGRTDEPLSLLGIEQARVLTPKLPVCDAVFSSPLLRCRQTADKLFPGYPVNILNDLRECDFGAFEGKNYSELKNDPEYIKWLSTNYESPIPGGENLTVFSARCCEAFTRAALSLPENVTAAFVTHGGCIMAILGRYAWPRREFYEYYIKNCQYLTCDFENKSLVITGDSLC
ncbi:MAG: phosphoglycerate mutase family protein [Clostridiales bacterium]|jgi:alpha-ribazole phosphatase|nr:phosphoglycerate mutase family protein [Clostridiales bacterium]